MAKDYINGAFHKARVFNTKTRSKIYLQPSMRHTPFSSLSIYKNGKLIRVVDYRKKAIQFCEQNEEPNSIMYIRIANKLVYFKEYGQKPILFNGFHIENWSKKVFPRSLSDFECHTSKETTLKYEAITYALEQSVNEQSGE